MARKYLKNKFNLIDLEMVTKYFIVEITYIY